MSSSFWAIQAAKNKKNELVPGTSKWVANELYSMNSDVLTHTEAFYYGISSNVQELNEFMKGVVAGQDDKSLLSKLLAQEEEDEKEEEEKEISKDQKSLKSTNGTAMQNKIERSHDYGTATKLDSTLEADTTNGYENIMSPRLSPIMNNTTVTTQKMSKYTPKTPSPLKSDALSEKTNSNADLSFIPIANTINPNKLDRSENRQTDEKQETSGGYASTHDDSFKAISTAIRKSIAGKSGPNFAAHSRQTDGHDMFAKELSADVNTYRKDRNTTEDLKSDEHHVNALKSSRKRQTRTPKQIARTPKRTSVFVSLPSREPLTISSSSSKSVSGLSSMKGKPLKLFEKLDNASKLDNMLSSMQQSPVTIKRRKVPFENDGSSSISSTFIKESMKRRSLVKPIPLGGVKGRESQNNFDKRMSYVQSNKDKTQNEEKIHAVQATHIYTHKIPSSAAFMRMPDSIRKGEVQNDSTTEENFQNFKPNATAVSQGQYSSSIRKKSEDIFLVNDKTKHNEENGRGTLSMHRSTGLHTEQRSAVHNALKNDEMSFTSGNEMVNRSIKSPTLNSADSVLRRARNVFLTNSKSAGSQYDTTGISSTASPYKSGYHGPHTRGKSPIRLPTIAKPRKLSSYSPRNFEKPKRSLLVSPVRRSLKRSLRNSRSPSRVIGEDTGSGEFKHLQGKAESDLISRLMAPTSSSAAKSVRSSNRIKENEVSNTSKNKFLSTTLNPNKSSIPLKSMEKTPQQSHATEKIPDETSKETKIPFKIELNNIPPLKKKSLMAERSEAAAQKPKQKIVIAMNHKLDTKVPQNLIPLKGNGRELKERNTPIDQDYTKVSMTISDIPDLQISNSGGANEQGNAEGYRKEQREPVAEHRSVVSQGLANKTRQNERKTPNMSRMSYNKTPKRKQIKDLEALKTPSESQSQQASNLLPDIPTDEEDLKSQRALQSWAESPQLRKILLQNRNIDPVSIFGEVPRLDIDEIFESQASRSRGKASPLGHNNRNT